MRPLSLRRLIGGAMAAVTACTGLVVATAPPASAATVYEITGEWEANTPTMVHVR